MWVNKSLQQSPIFMMWRPKSVAPFIQTKWNAFKISAKINTITSVSQHTDLKSRAEMNQRLIFSSANQIHMLGLYSTGLMKEIPACRCKGNTLAPLWISAIMVYGVHGTFFPSLSQATCCFCKSTRKVQWRWKWKHNFTSLFTLAIQKCMSSHSQITSDSITADVQLING